MKKLGILALALLFASLGYAQKGKSEALELIGGTSALLLYDAYLVVGMTADAYAAETYSSEQAAKLLGEQIGGIEAVEQQLDALAQSKFLKKADDKQFVVDLMATLNLVKAEGSALLKYVESNDKSAFAEYEEHRAAAWEKIKTLLGIE